MDIRRIIREEVNDFGWTEEITPIDHLTDAEKSGANNMLWIP